MRRLLAGLAAGLTVCVLVLALGGCGFGGGDVFRPYPAGEHPDPDVASTALLSALSAASGSTSRYGAAVAWLDWDDDGVDDVLIGAPGETVGRTPGAGVVELHVATEEGTFRHVRTLTQLDWSQAPAAEAAFGSALAVGDFDGDGLVDVAIGAPGEAVAGTPGAGRVYVLGNTPRQEGRALGPFADPSGPGRDAAFGAALASGPVDLGSIDDLVVGAPGAQSEGLPGAGHVVVYYDAQRAPFGEDVAGPVSSEEPVAGGAFGSALAIGDLGGEGIPEVCIGMPGAGGGRVETWRILAPDAAEWLLSNKASTRVQPVGKAVRFGAFLALADVDADGDLDLFVGAPRGDVTTVPETGWVDVLAYNTRTLRFGHLGRLHDLAPAPGARFGEQLACADFDGDGHLDLAVSAPFADGARSEFAGHVTVFHGDGAGRLLPPSLEDRWRALLPHPGALHGASLAASAGERGVGASLLIGAPGTGIQPNTPGRVELLTPALP